MADKKLKRIEAEMQYSGPLPLAKQMGEYENICPGAADRIISMAEKQALHRQRIEEISIKANARNSTLGVCFGGLIGVGAIVGGIYIIISGYEVSGYVTMLAPLATLVGVFVYGKESSKKELIEKQRLMNMVRRK